MNKQSVSEYLRRQESVQTNMVRRQAQREGRCTNCFSVEAPHYSWCSKK